MPEHEANLPAVKKKLNFDAIVRQTLSAEDITVTRAAARRRRTTTIWDNDPTDPIIQLDDDPTDPIRSSSLSAAL